MMCHILEASRQGTGQRHRPGSHRGQEGTRGQQAWRGRSERGDSNRGGNDPGAYAYSKTMTKEAASTKKRADLGAGRRRLTSQVPGRG